MLLSYFEFSLLYCVFASFVRKKLKSGGQEWEEDLGGVEEGKRMIKVCLKLKVILKSDFHPQAQRVDGM